MKKLILFMSILAYGTAVYADTIGKAIPDEGLQEVCTKVWIGGNKDVSQIMGMHWAFCSIKVHETCIALYRKGSSKAKADALVACNDIKGDGVTDQEAEALGATLNQYGIPVGGSPDDIRGMGAELTEQSSL